jgi:hypothetical protein
MGLMKCIDRLSEPQYKWGIYYYQKGEAVPTNTSENDALMESQIEWFIDEHERNLVFANQLHDGENE